MQRRLHSERRSVLQLLLALPLVFVLGCFQLGPFGTGTARAAAHIPANIITASPVPSAATDNAGNRFIFWRGVDASHDLWEGSYKESTNTWYGPTNIAGMGPLGSEPTVAVDTDGALQGYYGYQFVFWQGSDSHHNLWEAYWDGSWHGPINLGMGSLGSKPSATYDGEYNILTVAWRGRDGNLWYAHDQLDGGSQEAWQGPYSAAWGPMQNPPALADAGDGYIEAFWRGNDGQLWNGTLGAGGNVPFSGPYAIPQAGLLGSDPSASGILINSTVSYQGDPYYTVFWAGRDHGLWTINYQPGYVDPSPTELPNMGPLGSALGCAYWQDAATQPYYCFWAGDNAGYNLWMASADNTGTISGPTSLGMGPLQL